MPKKGDFGEKEISEHGNWNVASDYARLKIMKQLYLADEYETIATFGFVDFMDELNFNMDVDVLKIRGFKRLIKSLLMVINNSRFAIKKKEREKLDKMKDELNRFWKVIPVLYEYKVNQKNKTRELKIIEEDYNKAMDRIIEIKAEINEPLNKYDLIFSYKDEFDSGKAKEEIMKSLTERG